MWLLIPLAFAGDPSSPVVAPVRSVPVPAAASAVHPTTVRDTAASTTLLGEHALTLQWVSWETPGKVVVSVDASGVWHMQGEQRNGADFVTVDGTITEVDSKSFVFDGTIVTQVTYIAGGKACTRNGPVTFSMTGKRRYWRMQAMQNPCDAVTDYVDVYLRP